MDGARFKQQGENLTNPELAKTLKQIQNDPFIFYNGSLAQKVIDDIKNASGIMTLEDLKNYNVSIKQPLRNQFGSFSMLTMPPPGSGAVVSMILNILYGYNFSLSDLASTSKTVETYHKIVESFKWAYARRAMLGDPDFLPKDNISRVLDEMTNNTFADIIREYKILSNQTFNTSYYGGYYAKDGYGTSHVSILAPNGDAVSVTGTINYRFGAALRSLETGIIYNNEMDDFSTPGKSNLYGYPPTPANFIRPGKKPLSSMSPTIITDDNGDVKMVAGASGGSRIITGTALTIIRKLLFNMSLGPAVSYPRIHHQLLPDQVSVEQRKPIPMPVIDGLRKIGHVVKNGSYSVVQAIYKETNSKILAMSDPRKHGEPDGF